MKYEYWFANIKGLGNKEKFQIRSSIKTAEELYYMEENGGGRRMSILPAVFRPIQSAAQPSRALVVSAVVSSSFS